MRDPEFTLTAEWHVPERLCKQVQIELTMSYFYYWEHHHGVLPGTSVRDWLVGLEKTPNQARIYVSRLVDRGYREPEFIQFCNIYQLCALQAGY